MSTAESKLALVQMIVESEDKTFIAKMVEYARSLKKTKTGDSADEVPEHILAEITLAMEEFDNGTDPGIPHEEMMERFGKEYPNLGI